MEDAHAAVDRLLGSFPLTPDALLPLLLRVQAALGHVPPDAVPRIARAVNLSQAEVHSVLRFYSHFRSSPPGRHVVRLCRSEACQAVGAEALAAHAQQRLGAGFHDTSPDGAVTLEPVHCLGLCAAGPALMVDEREVRGRVTPESFDALVQRLRGGR